MWGRLVASLGRFPAIAPGVTLSRAATLSIGDYVKIDGGTFITCGGGSIEIGNRVSLNRDVYLNADVGGRISIGDDALIGPRTVARTCNHRFDDPQVPINVQGHECKNIEIGAGAWLGANVTLVPGAKVGAGTVVGAGSVVVGELPSNVLAAGNPAKVLRSRFSETDAKPRHLHTGSGE